MAAGWPAPAVVLPLLLLLWPAGRDGAGADDETAIRDAVEKRLCPENAGCHCQIKIPVDDMRLYVKCDFSGGQDIILKQLKGNFSVLNNYQVALELTGRDNPTSNLTVYDRTFEAFGTVLSLKLTKFAGLVVKPQGLLIKNANSIFNMTIGKVQRLQLDTKAIGVSTAGTTVDVLIENCGTVWLNSEVISKLRSFVFRKIDKLELSNNTFKKAAEYKPIEKMILENLSADKLPSNAFVTGIDMLLIQNCTFGSIESEAFPRLIMVNVTLVNVNLDRMESQVFPNSSLVTSLRMIGCRIREMETNALPFVESIHMEQTEFGRVSASAVSVSINLTLRNNTFGRVDGRGFVLKKNYVSVLVRDNDFARVDAEAFFETDAGQRSEVHVRGNVFREPTGTVFRLKQRAAVDVNVTDNVFYGSCGCGPWRFVVDDDDHDDDDDDNDDGAGSEFAGHNSCRTDEASAQCANLTAAEGLFGIGAFAAAAGCDRDGGETYRRCLGGDGATDAGGFGAYGNAFRERGVITTVVLLILSGFAAVCAVSAVTWLNARGYFMKLRMLFTRDDAGGRGGDHMGGRTMSAHSLSPMSVHEYTELHRPKLSGSTTVSDTSASAADGVRVIVYQDRCTQTVPDELTHEMLQELREKLDDPDDYAEARGMIEHLYDLIRVEEACGGSGAGSTCYSAGGGSSGVGRLDDMTSTITTKAVTVGPDGGRAARDSKTVATSTPSLDRLWPTRINAAATFAGGSGGKSIWGASAGGGGGGGRSGAYPGGGRASTVDNHHYSRPLQKPPPPPSPSVTEYMQPVDLLYETLDEGSYSAVYCELADLQRPRIGANGPGDGERAQQRPPPPVPDKPTKV